MGLEVGVARSARLILVALAACAFWLAWTTAARADVTGTEPVATSDQVDAPPAEGSESPAPTTESPPPVEESPPPVEEAPPPVEEAPPPVEEAPPPAEETPVPVTESPPPAEETPAPVAESPPIVEAPPPILEAPPPIVEAPPVGMPPEGFGGLGEPAEHDAASVFAPFAGVVTNLPPLTSLRLNVVASLESQRVESSAARQRGLDPGEKTRTKELRVPLGRGLHGSSSTSASGGLASGVSSGSASVLAALLALLLLAPSGFGSLLAVAVARPLRTALILQVERPG